MKSTLQPVQIIENGPRVYLISKEFGILLFSLFGTLEKLSSYPTSDAVYQWNNYIYFRMGNMLFSWDNNQPKPEVIRYFDTDQLMREIQWMMCEDKPFYFEPNTGIMREIPILENFKK